MGQQRTEITLVRDAQYDVNLEARLLSELRETLEQGENTQFTLRLTNPEGEALGGLVASTSYGWLLIKILFIDPSARKQGYGRDLVERALQEAKTFGCHSAWLDTSDPNAHQFYLSQGFVEFGRLSNERDQTPMGHQRWFMKRVI